MQYPLLHPRRRVALDHSQRIQANDQLGVSVESVDMRAERPVDQEPDHDSAEFGDYWHIGLCLSDAPLPTTPLGSAMHHVTTNGCVGHTPSQKGCQGRAGVNSGQIRKNGTAARATTRNFCTCMRTVCAVPRPYPAEIMPVQE